MPPGGTVTGTSSLWTRSERPHILEPRFSAIKHPARGPHETPPRPGRGYDAAAGDLLYRSHRIPHCRRRRVTPYDLATGVPARPADHVSADQRFPKGIVQRV